MVTNLVETSSTGTTGITVIGVKAGTPTVPTSNTRAATTGVYTLINTVGTQETIIMARRGIPGVGREGDGEVIPISTS